MTAMTLQVNDLIPSFLSTQSPDPTSKLDNSPIRSLLKIVQLHDTQMADTLCTRIQGNGLGICCDPTDSDSFTVQRVM